MGQRLSGAHAHRTWRARGCYSVQSSLQATATAQPVEAECCLIPARCAGARPWHLTHTYIPHLLAGDTELCVFQLAELELQCNHSEKRQKRQQWLLASYLVLTHGSVSTSLINSISIREQRNPCLQMVSVPCTHAPGIACLLPAVLYSCEGADFAMGGCIFLAKTANSCS